VFDSQRDEKISHGWILRQQQLERVTVSKSGHCSAPLPYEFPMHLDVDFYFKYPKAMSQKKRTASHYYVGAQDIDNMLKYVLDTGNGILWDDDRFIVSTTCRKLFDDNERTEITVKVLE